MATQLVKKNFGGKRKGYKGWKSWAKGIGSQAGWCALDPQACMTMAGAIFGVPMKKGGRVRGVGKAKRGLGKVMRKK